MKKPRKSWSNYNKKIVCCSQTSRILMNVLIPLNRMHDQSTFEIQCVLEQKTDNLILTVTQLGAVVGCAILQEQIVHCSRIAKMKSNSSQPKSVVVQFASRRICDEFLAASINFNRERSREETLNSSHLGFNEEKTATYIVDHLSLMNKILHDATRSTAKEKGYKHVWVRNGRNLCERRMAPVIFLFPI
ncbi:unnamed protein product [Euphydryas editha]|uniref:FP protein C-terminal domain-containing protein n=1 Tax=Euphydryas editha TaxID=104508 RepID=A0AAU9U3A9_EUPED|nr:unnamed protein product [Euphydryas editha]